MDSTPFNVNLTMGEIYLCLSIWFDNMYEKPAFLPLAPKGGAEGQNNKQQKEGESAKSAKGESGNDSEEQIRKCKTGSKQKAPEVRRRTCNISYTVLSSWYSC